MSVSLNAKQSLGKSTELKVASMLLDEGREVCIPLVDDHGIDLLVKTREFIAGDRSKAENYDFQEIQIKSVTNGGLFVFTCKEARPNYWFIFYVKGKDIFWLINSMELINGGFSYVNKSGKYIGHYTVPLSTRAKINEKYQHLIVENFNQIP